MYENEEAQGLYKCIGGRDVVGGKLSLMSSWSSFNFKANSADRLRLEMLDIDHPL